MSLCVLQQPRAGGNPEGPAAVIVEVHLTGGLSVLSVVGLAELAVGTLLGQALQRLGLSARAYHRVLTQAGPGGSAALTTMRPGNDG